MAAESGRPWICIQNKLDITLPAKSAGRNTEITECGGAITQSNAECAKGNCRARVCLSAKTGEGLDRLENAVAALFPAGESDRPGTFLTDQRQEEAARRAREAIARGSAALSAGFTPDAVLTDIEEALDAIGDLTGRGAKEEIVNRIFSRFCVGK